MARTGARCHPALSPAATAPIHEFHLCGTFEAAVCYGEMPTLRSSLAAAEFSGSLPFYFDGLKAALRRLFLLYVGFWCCPERLVQILKCTLQTVILVLIIDGLVLVMVKAEELCCREKVSVLEQFWKRSVFVVRHVKSTCVFYISKITVKLNISCCYLTTPVVKTGLSCFLLEVMGEPSEIR